MAKFQRVKAGDPITAEDYNAIAEALERFAKLSVAQVDYLKLWDFPDGKHLALHPPVETLALLSGSSSPYSFQEVDEDVSGALAVRGVGDSCTDCVYEVNGKSGLGGKVVRLTWTAAGDWRFQWVGFGGAPCDSTTRICLTINSGCTGIAAHGATIEAEDSDGVTYGPCTASGFVQSLTRTSGGSGYTNGTAYSLGFSGGGGSGVAGTFDVVGGVVTNLVLTDGGSGYITPPTISFPGAGAGSGAVGIANISAKCCIDVSHSGSYDVTISIPGATPVTTRVNVTCEIDNNFTASFPADALGILCIEVHHCGYADGGDVCIVKRGATTVTTVTTGSDGKVCLPVGTGSILNGTGYSADVTAPQGAAKTVGPVTVGACSAGTIGANTLIERCFNGLTDAPGCTINITLKLGGVTIGTGSVTTAFDGVFYSGAGCVMIPEVFDPGSVTLQTIMACPAHTYDDGGLFTTGICAPPGAPVFFDFRGLPCC